jgi:sulfatase modifying factor 1
MRMMFNTVLIGLGFIASSQFVQAQTVLNIAPTGSQSVLFWPDTPVNYIVQSATNLTSPNWVAADDAFPVSAVTVSNTPPSRFFRLIATNAPAGMALVPAGVFTLGNSVGDTNITDANPTNVYISAFYMDTNLVSYDQWQAVYAYAITNGYVFVNAGAGNATNQPVQSVDWFDALIWCNARSQQAGLTPVYYTDAGFTQVFAGGEGASVYVNWTANGFRLPTEAEWEKAARGGLTARRFPWGNLISPYQANYFGSVGQYAYDFSVDADYNEFGSVGDNEPATSPLATFDKNGYGLYDMAGNVFEWCWDWYAESYAGNINPHGPDSGTTRVLRGGDWEYDASFARCANRFVADPSLSSYDIGLRCVRKL